jgi:hypothetical protein
LSNLKGEYLKRSVAFLGGPANLEIDERERHKYRYAKCYHIDKSSGKKSVCPDANLKR